MESNINKASASEKPMAAGRLIASGKLLGILQQNPEIWFKGNANEGILKDTEIEKLILQRAQARDKKDFQQSDKIREKLAEEGIILEDGTENTTWKRY
jgi:cysteinyl-tRNA synthetase